MPTDLKEFVARIRKHANVPLAVGFGISTPEQVADVSALAEGVVVGSAIINCLDNLASKTPTERCQGMEAFIRSLSSAIVTRDSSSSSSTVCTVAAPLFQDIANRSFGEYGGRYIPETLMEAHKELEIAYAAALADPKFHEEVAFYRREFIGGPTPLYFAKNLTEKVTLSLSLPHDL